MGKFSAYDGLEVEQVWVWYSLRLVFDLGPPGEPGVYIDVTSFDFTEPEGTVHQVDVEKNPLGAGVVLGLLHHRVRKAAVEEWELRLEFDNGAALTCPPDDKYEAWQAQLPDQAMTIFCPPGGGSGSPT